MAVSIERWQRKVGLRVFEDIIKLSSMARLLDSVLELHKASSPSPPRERESKREGDRVVSQHAGDQRSGGTCPLPGASCANQSYRP